MRVLVTLNALSRGVTDVAISKKEVEHVALLSRLEVNDEEIEEYTGQLSAILEYVRKLDELDTTDIEPTAHVLPMHNVFREDRVEDGIPRETALKNAPDQEKGCYRVPKIV